MKSGSLSAVSRFVLNLLFVCVSVSVFSPATAVERIRESFKVGDSVYVRALMVDKKAGALWVGTSTGVLEIDLAGKSVRRTLTRDSGLANEYVFAIGQDAEGAVWFGTNAGGTSRLVNGKLKTYFPMHGLADYWIYAFASDKDGDLWIGTWAGANRFNLKSGQFKTYVKELVNEWVYGLGVDRKGRVWFGTEGGVSMFDGKQWRSWTHKDGLGGENVNKLGPSVNTGLGTRKRHDLTTMVSGGPSYNPSYVFSLLVDSKDLVWAGTWGGGVGYFDGKAWKNFTTKEGLAGNIVYSIIQGADGAYWFGTDAGVSKYDGKTWTKFGLAEGLLDTHVYALALSPSGDIWAGTRKGVVRIGGQD